MKVLAIETATTVCAAAVVSEGKVLSEAILDEKYVHAEKLMTQVDTVLRQCGYSLNQIDAIAVSIGPGSFTGLRIGLSVAKGLAFATGKPLIAVPTLHALAQRVIDVGIAAESDTILAALDARRDEVYCQWFIAKGGSANPLTQERDLPTSKVLEESMQKSGFVTGDAASKVCAEMSGQSWRRVPETTATCSAGTIGILGEKLYASGEVANATTLEPRYIKEFFFKQQA